MNGTRRKMREQYKGLLEDICDILEGGDVALDFEDAPHKATTIGCIMAIVSNELSNMRATDELFSSLAKVLKVE